MRSNGPSSSAAPCPARSPRLVNVPWARLLVAVCTATLLAPGALGAQRETFSGSTAVIEVQVPVQVVDREGNPIRGLTVENFEVLDGRTKQEIVSFETVDRSDALPAGPAIASVPAAARRHFLYLFDMTFSEPSAVVKARVAGEKLLAKLHPSDLVAVATYSRVRGPELLIGFTTDRRQARAALYSLGAPKLLRRTPDPLGTLIADTEGGSRALQTDWQSVSEPEGPGAGIKPTAQETEAEVREALEDVLDTLEQANRSERSTAIRTFTRAMEDLARLMRSVEGRKYVLFMSEGVDDNALVGEDPALRERQGAGERQNETSVNIEGGNVWDVDTDQMFGSGSAQNALEKMLEEFRRANCSIQSVDIAGLRDGAQARGGQQSLVAMARSTGGDVYRNYNDLGVAMEKMLRRTDLTYLLSFVPQDLKSDGKYRKLKVRLKDAPRGARIVHRPGYFAPDPDGRTSPLEDRLRTASELLAGDVGGDIDIDLFAVPIRAAEPPASVPVMVELDGESLFDSAGGSGLQAEIYAYAIDQEGSVADYLHQTLGFGPDQVAGEIRSKGIKFFGNLDLAPGDYNLRVLVRNTVTGASGLQMTQVSVPDFAQPELVVLPPLIPESFDRWMMVRQPATPGERDVPYPFTLQQGQSFLPATVGEGASGSIVPVGVFAYNLGGSPTLDAQLLDERGYVVLGQQLSARAVEDGADDGATRLLAQLQLAGVPEGEYTLSLTLHDAVSGQRASSFGRLKVGPPDQAAAGTAPPPPPAGQAGRGERRNADSPEVRSGYREALRLLSSGREVQARERLESLETDVARRSEDVLLQVLSRSELSVAQALSRRDPDSLIPLIMLHYQVYLDYLDRQERLLARHSRTMVRDLARLYERAGTPPANRQLASKALTSLGGSLQQAGATYAAFELFREAVALDPSNGAARLSMAVYQEKVGDYRQATALLRGLVEARPEIAEGWLRLGVNLYRLEKVKDAKTWLLRAQRPEAAAWIRSLAFQEMARIFVAEGRLSAADKVLSEGLEVLPGDPRLSIQRALVLDRLGRRRESASVLQDLKLVSGELLESPRYFYNRWPAHAIESSREELKTSAEQNLMVLSKAMERLTPASSR